jgi:hypothetical protein
LRAVGCVSVSDNRLVNELRECRVGSTESRLEFSHEGAIPSKKPIMSNGLYPCGVGKKLFAVEKNI